MWPAPADRVPAIVAPGVLAVTLAAFDPAQHLLTPSTAFAAALGEAGRTVRIIELEIQPDGSAEVLLLGDDELSRAGDHAEGLIAEAARALRPGGTLLTSVRNPLVVDSCSPTLTGGPARLRGFRSAQLEGALTNRGFVVELLAAPGAAARLAGSPDNPVYHPTLDRSPGLLDAAPRVVAVARAPVSPSERSAQFLRTLPRKVVAAAVLCRDEGGRVLVVYDAFRRHWTIPGGVVDREENPILAAEREAWEETGVRVRAGTLLGVFASSWPERVILVYEAAPAEPTPAPRPVHAHEVTEAAWVDLSEALRRVAPHVREQIERCLAEPGGTWTQ
ncbi:MAG: NUDIX domain-containing protein [Nitriliruptorales bacterium]|nr:NUDIX domain-containing protein [Nitriliruptorales bacterium]